MTRRGLFSLLMGMPLATAFVGSPARQRYYGGCDRGPELFMPSLPGRLGVNIAPSFERLQTDLAVQLKRFERAMERIRAEREHPLVNVSDDAFV